MSLSLERRRSFGPAARPTVFSELPVRFPEAVYPVEPLGLYQYGRFASGLPLLQFLAYYQVVEFFFPMYSKQEVVRRLRIALKQPSFDVNDDLALSRVLATVLPAGRASTGGERDQLRLTLRACLEPGIVRELIEASEEYCQHFTSKDQRIRGASRILLHEGHPDLRDQTADRLYAIRCRVVHTKQDGGNVAINPLLPWSSEANYMAPEVALMRIVAQQVLAAAGQTPHFS